MRIEAKKSLGQNFLRDANIAEKIVRELQVQAGDAVLEVGPGTGALTKFLLQRGCIVTAVEKDFRAVESLQSTFSDSNFTLIHGDIQTFNLAEYSRQWKENTGKYPSVIGNIPYYITSEILFQLYNAAGAIDKSVIMMQKEVAERLVAKPRTKEYGILTVAANLSGSVKKIFDVSPKSFSPQPKVTSTVMRFELHSPIVSRTVFRECMTIVKTTFQQRRKILSNTLKSLKNYEAIAEDSQFEKLLKMRPEELTAADFLLLHSQMYVS